MPAPTPYIVVSAPLFGEPPSFRSTRNSDCGPWVSPLDGSRVVAVVQYDNATGNSYMTFRKTADGTVPGAFGPPLDFANAPAITNGDAGTFTCYQRPGETTISYLIQDYGKIIVGLGVFDLATQLYVSFVALAITSGGFNDIWEAHIVKLSDGSYVLFYQTFDAAGTHMIARPCTAAGVLGAAVHIEDATGPNVNNSVYLMSVAVDKNDTCHILSGRSQALVAADGPWAVHYSTFTAGALTVQTTIVAGTILGNGIFLDMEQATSLRGYYNSTQDKAYLPIVLSINSANAQVPGSITVTTGAWGNDLEIVRIDAASTAPVAVQENVSNDDALPPFTMPNWASPVIFTNVAETIFYIAVVEYTVGNIFMWCRAAASPGAWQGKTDWWSNTVTPPPGGPVINLFPLSIRDIGGGSFGVALGFVDVGDPITGVALYYMEGDKNSPCIAPPPPPSTGGGGGIPPGKMLPASYAYSVISQWDGCLAWDWRVYNDICYLFRGCNKPPECIMIEDGRDNWDSDFPDDSAPWPSDAIVFNPQGGIPLPNPLAGDTVIMSFLVPVGYDGLILGYFHGYTLPFADGSGDLVWRLRASGRYLRDFGAVPAQMGSFISLSPVPGGLVVHSGNLIQYIVTAPNTTGSLPVPGPQAGQVFAGIHGWFYPRK